MKPRNSWTGCRKRFRLTQPEPADAELPFQIRPCMSEGHGAAVRQKRSNLR